MSRFAWLLAAAVSAPGCAQPPTAIYHPGLDKERFTRANLRPEQSILRAANYLSLPSSIPAGSPARITMYAPEVIRMTINGFEYAMYPCPPGAIKFSTDGPGIEAFLKKYFVDRREDLNLEGLGPAELKDGILGGRPAIGMTKEQVYLCLGPPLEIDDGVPALRLAYERILASDKWVYPSILFLVESTRVTLYFGDGKLKKGPS